MKISLKAQNRPIILIFSLILGVILFTSARGSIKVSDIIALDGYYNSIVFAGAITIVTLVISEIIPTKLKLFLVYWKLQNPTPGSRAFSEIMHHDYRIDTDILKKNYGELPTNPEDQDKKFYQIYKPIQNDIGIIDAHKSYLLFRELTIVTVFFLLFGPITVYIISSYFIAALIFFLVCTIFYFIMSFAAQRAGYRFVTNTLAVASIEVRPAQSS